MPKSQCNSCCKRSCPSFPSCPFLQSITPTIITGSTGGTVIATFVNLCPGGILRISLTIGALVIPITFIPSSSFFFNGSCNSCNSCNSNFPTQLTLTIPIITPPTTGTGLLTFFPSSPFCPPITTALTIV
jgi:hypothetical protein